MENLDAQVIQLGERYMQNPSVANQLLHALIHHNDGALLIEQRWLNCHWDNPHALQFLVDISDVYGMAPEPLREFFHVCWARNEHRWHHFLTLDMLEEDPELAEQMYTRFATEGPTDAVIDSMMFLQGSLDSDVFAADVISDIVNRGMLENPCTGLLKLWRRYGVCEGLLPPTMQALSAALNKPSLANLAVRAIECLKFRDIKPMLGQITALACKGTSWDIATRRARRIIVDVSSGIYCKHVARAICTHHWQSWMTRLHYACQWRLLDHMCATRAIDPMIDLMNTFPASSIRHGVLTRILQMKPDYFERADMHEVPPDSFPTSVHAAVHYMYMRGQPPPVRAYFYVALDLYPDAVHFIAAHAPKVQCEVKWARRKLLLCALVEHNARRHAKTTKLASSRLLHTLAAHECVWPAVMQFL